MSRSKVYLRQYNERNKDHIKAYKKDHYLRNRPQRLLGMRAYTLMRNFGLTEAHYAVILAAQDNRCAICGRSARCFTKKLAVDHDHKTGVIRGLLCPPCNKNIVSTFDSPLFKRAQRYMNVNLGLKISSGRFCRYSA